jgi:predicted nucleic acid-binding protein
LAVVDASAVVEFLLGRQPAAAWVAAHLRTAARVRAPHLIDAEVISALRSAVAAGDVSVERASAAVSAFPRLTLRRYRMTPLLPRMWALRASVSAYDAAYVALAEAFDEPLITADRRLGRSHGHRARIEAFST